MPRPYQPPLPRHSQGVPSASRGGPGQGPPRDRRGGFNPPGQPDWRRLLPLLALVPILLAVVGTRLQLGSQSSGGAPTAVPQTAGVQGTPVGAAGTPTAQATAAARPTTAAAAAGNAAPTANPSGATTSATTSTSSGAASTTSATSSGTANTGGATSGNANSATGAAPAGTASSGSTSAGLAGSDSSAQSVNGGPFRVYRVQPGDTLRGIADANGVSMASLINASALRNPDSLRVGQVLTIPSQPGYLYRVQPGETLDQIAARSGVSSDTIAAASQLSTSTVTGGEVLLIPQTRSTFK